MGPWQLKSGWVSGFIATQAMRIREESQPENSGLAPVGALQNSTPSRRDCSGMPKHPLAFHTGFEWIAIIKGLRHLKSVENPNEAFADLVHGACPNREIADLFLGICQRYPSISTFMLLTYG